MAQSEDILDSYVDRTGVQADTDFMVKQLTEVYDRLKKINEFKITLDGAKTFKAAGDVIKQYNQEQEKLLKLQKSISSAVPGTSKIKADAFTELNKAYRETIGLAKSLAAEFGAQDEKAIEAAKSAALLKQKIDEINASVKAGGKTKAEDIPYSTNLADIEKEKIAIQETTEAVNDYDIEQANAAMAANEWASTQKQVSESVDETKDSFKGVVLTFDEYTGTLHKNLIAQRENKESLILNKKEQKEIEEAIKKTGVSTEEQRSRLTALKVEELQLSETNKSLTTTIRNQIQEYNAAGGSIDELQAQVNLLQQQYEALSEAERSSPFGLELKKNIDQLEPKVKELEAGIGKFGRNVGNYQGSAKIIVDALSSVEKKMGELQEKQQGLLNFSKANPIGFKLGGGADQLNQVNAQLETTQKEFKALNTITSDPRFFNLASVGTAKTEVRGFTTTLIELEQKGLGKTDFANELRKHLAQLTDQISDTREEIKAMASDSRGFDQLNSSVRFLTNSYQTFVGIQALAGDQSEEVQETIKKLVAVQAVANGLQEVSEQLTKRGTIVNKAYALVQGLVKTALDSTATASVRAAAATKLLLGGLAIGAIVFIIAKLIEWKKSINEVSAEQKLLNQVNEKAIEGYSKEVSQLEVLRIKLTNLKTPQSERISLAKEYNKTADESAKIDLKQIGNIDLLNSAIDRQIAKIKERALAQAAANVTEEKAATLFKAEQKVTEIDPQFVLNLDRIDEQIKEIKRKSDDVVADYQFTGKNQSTIISLGKLRDALIEVKQANEDFTRSANLTAKLPGSTPPPPPPPPPGGSGKTKENDQVDKDLKARFDLYKLEKERELELLSGIIDDESKSYTERLLAAINYIETKQKLIGDVAEFEKKINKKSKDESALIDKQAALDKVRAAEGVEKKLIEIQNRIKKGESKSNIATFDTIDISSNSVYDEIIRKLDEYEKKQKLIAETEKTLASERKERLNNLVSQVKEAFFEFASISIDKQSDEISSQIDLLDKRKEREISIATQSIQNEQQRSEAIAGINAKAAVQRDVFEKRQRQLDIQKAKIEKESALLSVGIDTAKSVFKIKAEAAVLAANPVTAAYAPIALAQIPLVLLSGLLAETLIAARPLPKFYKGKNYDSKTHDSYDGPAIVDDGPDGRGNKPELIIREDGSMEVGSNEPRVTYLKKNDIVYPDAKKALEQRMIIEKLPMVTAKEYKSDKTTNNKSFFSELVGKLPRFFIGKNAKDPVISILFPTNKKENRIQGNNSEVLPSLVNAEINERLIAKQIPFPDSTMLWQMTKSATEEALSFNPDVNLASNALNREDYMLGVKKLESAIKNQPKPKKPDVATQLMKAWVSSDKSFKDFFG
jgi:hypothetical protein